MPYFRHPFDSDLRRLSNFQVLDAVIIDMNERQMEVFVATTGAFVGFPYDSFKKDSICRAFRFDGKAVEVTLGWKARLSQ